MSRRTSSPSPPPSTATASPRAAATLAALLAAAGCQPAPSAPAAAQTPETSPSPPIEAVASVQQIMDAMVIPGSAAIWNVASEAPTDDEGWTQLEQHAVRVSEAGNLLLLGERDVDDQVWRETSILLRKSGAQALAAIAERDAEGVIDAGNVMIDSCELCHEKHLVR